MKMIVSLVALAAAFALFSQSAEAKCKKSSPVHYSGGNVTLQYTWTVRSGGSCVYNNHIWGGTYAVYGIEVPRKPKHGIVGHGDSRYSIAYHADKNYKGDDYFEFQIVMRENGQTAPVTSQIHVRVI
jgi:hypothetical protein